MDDMFDEPTIPDQVRISQTEADRLISCEKECTSRTKYTYPSQGSHLEIPIRSTDKKENFKLTIRPGKISISKTTDQLREKNTNLILVRVDIGDRIGHTNPDGTIISGNHIHIYQEGYEDRIAQELPKDFVNPADPYQTLKDFMKYCSITKTPTFNTGVDQYGN